MDDIFCKALCDGMVTCAHARLARIVSATGIMNTDSDPSYRRAISAVATWLLESGCVGSVRVNEGLLKTRPPRKVLVLGYCCSDEARSFEVTLSLGHRLEVCSLEVRNGQPHSRTV